MCRNQPKGWSLQRQENPGAQGHALEGENLEVALAGEDDGEIFAVGGDAEFTDGEAVEQDVGSGFGDGDWLLRLVGD